VVISREEDQAAQQRGNVRIGRQRFVGVLGHVERLVRLIELQIHSRQPAHRRTILGIELERLLVRFGRLIERAVAFINFAEAIGGNWIVGLILAALFQVRERLGGGGFRIDGQRRKTARGLFLAGEIRGGRRRLLQGPPRRFFITQHVTNHAQVVLHFRHTGRLAGAVFNQRARARVITLLVDDPSQRVRGSRILGSQVGGLLGQGISFVGLI